MPVWLCAGGYCYLSLVLCGLGLAWMKLLGLEEKWGKLCLRRGGKAGWYTQNLCKFLGPAGPAACFQRGALEGSRN